MNDKCAAGTGRFLSAAADVTGIGLDQIGPVSLEATAPVRLGLQRLRKLGTPAAA
jgi:activator of 2-hydroxyglutaryl-CoA dehydratase